VPFLDRDLIRATATALASATLGGALFATIGLPAPWLSGAMVGATLAVIARQRIDLPHRLRDLVMLVLGISMGAGVTPASLAAMGRWPLSLLALALAVLAIMAASMLVLRRWGWSAETSFYASAPGALTTVMILAEASGANVRRVVVAQSLRLFVLVAVLPSVVVLVQPSSGVAELPAAASGVLRGPWEWLAVLAAALAGAVFAKALNLPAGVLLGAFIGSALLYAPGLVASPLPGWVMAPSFVVLGVFIALRFQGTTLADLKAEIGAALASLAVASAIAVAAAALVSLALGLPLAEVLVAYAPGGVEAMTIMAFALNLDVAYVATHHLARFIGIALALPFAARLLFGRPAAAL
jgi:membrane AbrB-like protein